MESEALGLTQYMIGIIVAVSTFIIKDVVGDRMAAVRFRRRLIVDLKEMVAGYEDHLPEIVRLYQKAEELRDNDSTGKWSFIWDVETQNPEYILAHASHLSEEQLEKCLSVYGAAIRIDEIRQKYNGAVERYVSGGKEEEGEKTIAVACLADLQRNYELLIEGGRELCEELASSYWLMPNYPDREACSP